jgi:hypothetical protein
MEPGPGRGGRWRPTEDSRGAKASWSPGHQVCDGARASGSAAAMGATGSGSMKTQMRRQIV